MFSAQLKNKRREGFTILELTITVAIVALLSAAVVGYQRSAGSNRELLLDTQKVMQDLRRVQNFALSVKTARCGAQTIAISYGIRFDPDAGDQAVYYVFNDCNDNKRWASNETAETTSLASSAITAVVPSAGGLDVVFVPPFPDVAINGDSTTAGRTGTITICHLKDASSCKTVQVNEKGAISIQ